MSRAWKLMAAVALLLAAASMMLSAWLFKLNADRVTEINLSRAENVRRNCDDVNDRNRRTVAELNRLTAKRLRDASPAERTRLRASVAATVGLINALAPRRHCAELARSSVQPAP